MMNALIAWFARNSVAANMLLVGIMVMGFLLIQKTPKEILPGLEPERISIVTTLAGASPGQAEKLLCSPIERAISSVEHIEKIQSTASTSRCVIVVDMEFDSDITMALNRIEERIRLTHLPENASRPAIQQSNIDVMVARMAVVGNIDYRSLLSQAEAVQQDLIELGLSKTILRDTPSYQITIEVSESRLQQYQLTFSEVAQALTQNASDIAAGNIQTDQTRASVIVAGDYSNVDDIASTVIRTFPDGGQLKLADIAVIHDGFADTTAESRVNGKPAISISVYQDRSNNVEDIAAALYRYIDETPMADNIELLMLQDNSAFFTNRMALLQNNAISGLILVFIALVLFLRTRLAFWVTMGIPVAFFGGFIVLYLTGGTINMVSTFGLLIVLGVVTDDAIVVGENIHRHQLMGKSGIDAAISGTTELAMPVFIAVLTNAITFIPLMFLPGAEGRIAGQIPLIVIAVLAFSLLECFFILPAHLAHNPPRRLTAKLSFSVIDKLNHVIFRIYRPFLQKALHWRYLTLTAFSGLFIICCSLLLSGWVNVSFQLSAEAEVATGYVGFPAGSDPQLTRDAIQRMESAALTLKQELAKEYGIDQIQHIRTSVGNNANGGFIFMNLATARDRKISGRDIMQRWRSKVGSIPEASHLSFSSTIEGGDQGLSITLNARDSEALRQASTALKLYLQEFDGVFNIRDSFLNVNQEVRVQLKPAAYELGLSLQTVSAQIRAAFSGMTLAPLERDGAMIGVSLRLPEPERNSLWHLENLPIRLMDGSITPLYAIADLHYDSSPNSIVHVDGHRIASVNAQVDESIILKSQLNRQIQRDFLDDIAERFPGVYSGRIGSNEAEKEMKERLWLGFSISLLAMYVLMASLFGSYFQPLLILSSIPFGLIGAFLGHVMLGIEMTFLSLAGMIAVGGIVINDELVMVHYINEKMKEGMALKEAVVVAGVDRFLAVFLTSITTFFGLLPILLESSWEAQFLIPLGISIAFGVMFSTFVTLLLLPVLHLIGDDIRRQIIRTMNWLRHKPLLNRFMSPEEMSPDHH